LIPDLYSARPWGPVMASKHLTVGPTTVSWPYINHFITSPYDVIVTELAQKLFCLFLLDPAQFISFLGAKVLLEKLIAPQLVSKFPAFYGTRRFKTVFTRVRHWCIPWSTWTQSTSLNPVSLRSILILSVHQRLGFPNSLFPSGVLTKLLHAFLVSLMLTTCTLQRVIFDFATLSKFVVI
jgi:hypothetical protein